VPLKRREVAGLEYLDLVTTLLRRATLENPDGAVWVAADLQWWWRRDQHLDPARQVFWCDGDTPEAAVVMMDWGKHFECVLLSSDNDLGSVHDLVWPEALDQFGAGRRQGKRVELAVCIDDLSTSELAQSAGFEATDDIYTINCMDAGNRPQVSPLVADFVLASRSDRPEDPHPMRSRNGEQVAEFLRQCSLYDPELDLCVYAPNGDVAGYGLFWAEDAYERMGIARHVLTSGLDLVAKRGCTCLKIVYENANEVSTHIYRSSGFQPVLSTRTFVLSADDVSLAAEG
jgi:GNAT superfamily N-acetyltransferase